MSYAEDELEELDQAGAGMLLLLEGAHRAGLLHYPGIHTRLEGDIGAVAVGGHARRHVVEEGDLVLHDAHHVIKGDAGVVTQLVHEAVVVGRKEDSRGAVERKVLQHGIRDRVPVPRTRAPTQLVEHHQRVARGVLEDVGGLLQLHHERGLPCGDVVRRPAPREDAVETLQAAGCGRNVASHLREDHREARLAEDRGLAPHVGPGQHDDAARARPRGARHRNRVSTDPHVVGHDVVGRSHGEQRVTQTDAVQEGAVASRFQHGAAHVELRGGPAHITGANG
mmetsp:Transcript_29909/g.83604  ORF Transcript_29909/g.83604 Transcript_29909/m.83604 type:complete len:281 (-) Transcript_29909:63-905(-)